LQFQDAAPTHANSPIAQLFHAAGKKIGTQASRSGYRLTDKKQFQEKCEAVFR
jgi:hypothetical protein